MLPGASAILTALVASGLPAHAFYFGGFLPLIAAYIVAKTGNAYSGLWYTWVFTAIALLVAWWGLPDWMPFAHPLFAEAALFADRIAERARGFVAEGKPLDSQQAKRQGYEDILWAIINTKEFLFNH